MQYTQACSKWKIVSRAVCESVHSPRAKWDGAHVGIGITVIVLGNV